MPVYAYRATDAQGRLVDGQLEAKSTDAVVERLHRLAFYPLEIRAAEEEAAEHPRPLLSRFGRRKKVVFFTSQLATLLESGLPVDRSLAIMEDLTDSRGLSEVTRSVREAVEEGSSLADALKREPGWFDELYVNMVRAGETGGVLEIVLRRLADYLEASQRTRDVVAASLAYPLVLILFSILAVVFILVGVLPRFAQIFADMGDMVPLPAKVLLGVSGFLGHWWWAMVLGAGVLAAAVVAWIRTPEGRLWWDRSRLGWPLVGGLLTRLETARFARTLGTLLSGGVPVLQAVDIVGETVRNRHLASFMGDLRNGLRKGEGMVAPLRRTGAFPPLFVHMASVGEETGRLEEMLVRTAAIYEREAESATKGLLSILEPLILVALGIVLGGIILTILTAIFSVYRTTF